MDLPPGWRMTRARGEPKPADRVELVRVVAEQLAAASGLHAVAEVAASFVREGLGATSVVMAVLERDGSTFDVPVADGLSVAAEKRLTGKVPLDDWPAAQAALRERRPRFWSTLADRDLDSPDLAELPSQALSWAVLPLVVQGSPLGVLSIGWPEEREFTELDAAFLEVIAHQCAVAADRAQLDAVRRAEREVLELLSDGSRVIVSAREPQQVLDALVELAVPRLAPWCAVYVAERRMLRRVAVHVDEEEELAVALRGQVVISVDDPVALAVAFRTGEPQVMAVEESLVRQQFPKEQADRIIRHAATWRGIAVPVKAGGEPIGALSLLSPAWGTGTPDQVRFAVEGLASRAGVALVNARRFDLERRTANMLMEAFLPTEIPEIPGFEVAARYLPAGARIAGDWYDVVALPSGEILVGIGDAGGHGIPAASLMGQLRNAARGLAMTGLSPGAVLDALQLVTATNGDDSFATALYAKLDPTGHTARWATAGHLAPLRFAPGTAAYLDAPRSVPLGTPARPSEERVDRWDRGQGVVLFTDGVVERRGRSLDEGMAMLQDLVRRHSTDRAGDLTCRIVAELCDEPEDDCCVVVLRRT